MHLLYPRKSYLMKSLALGLGPVISNEFDEVIFPKIDEAIRMTLNDIK